MVGQHCDIHKVLLSNSNFKSNIHYKQGQALTILTMRNHENLRD